MAITLADIARNAAASAVGDMANGGTLVFKASGGAAVATLTFSSPAFGAAASGVITANAIAADDSVAGGTITNFEVLSSVSAVILSGSVTATGGGGDFILTDVTYGAGSRLEVSGMTYTQPA